MIHNPESIDRFLHELWSPTLRFNVVRNRFRRSTRIRRSRSRRKKKKKEEQEKKLRWKVSYLSVFVNMFYAYLSNLLEKEKLAFMAELP